MRQLPPKATRSDAFGLFDSFDAQVVRTICARLETDYGIGTMTPADIDEVHKLLDLGMSCVIFVGQNGTGALGQRLTATFGEMRRRPEPTGAIIPVLLPGGTWEWVKADRK